MRLRRNVVAGGIVGGLAWSGATLAQQPINLLAPTPLAPPTGTAIQATPLPPPTFLSPPAAGATALPGPAVTTLLMLPATVAPRFDAAVPYLETAQSSILGRRYAAAGKALEQAETRLLNDGAGTARETGPAAGQALLQVRQARQALAERDQAGALAATGQALASIQAADSQAQTAAVAQVKQPAPLPPPSAAVPPEPMITKALLPGHWQLSGWQYHWVPPEMQLRPVDTRAFVPGHDVWRDGAWVWDAGHYGDD